MTLVSLLLRRAAAEPRRPALVDARTGETWDYRRLGSGARRVAAALRSRGSRPRERVGILAVNRPDSFVHILGTALGDAIPVPIDERLKAPEAAALLKDCGVRRLLVPPGRPPGESLLPGVQTMAIDPARGPDPPAGAHPRPADVALVWCTSGTQGGAKGAALSHAALMARWEPQRRVFGLTRDTRFHCALSLAQVATYALQPLYNGGALVLAPRFGVRDAPRFWDELDRLEAHTALIVPAIARLLMMIGGGRPRRKPRSLRFILSTGSPMGECESRGFEEALGIPLLDCYGLKETGLISLTAPPPARRVHGTAGRPRTTVLRVADPSGRPCPRGREGEIMARGPSMASGYCRAGRLRPLPRRGGWFPTGDLGTLDAGGFLRVGGRLAERIDRAGLKLLPEDVEAVLKRHGAVADAAVAGLPDPVAGQAVVAFIVPRERRPVSDEELRSHCRRFLADYKCPARFVRIAAVPRDSLGKVRRPALPGLLSRPI